MIIRHYDHFVKRLNVAHMNIGGRIDRIGKLCGPWIKNLTSVSRMFLWANVSSDTRGVGFMPSYKNVKPITSCVNTMNCSLGETELGKLKLKEQTNKPVCFTSSVLEYFRVENNTVFMGRGGGGSYTELHHFINNIAFELRCYDEITLTDRKWV